VQEDLLDQMNTIPVMSAAVQNNTEDGTNITHNEAKPAVSHTCAQTLDDPTPNGQSRPKTDLQEVSSLNLSGV